MLSKLYKYLAIAGTFITTVLLVLVQSLRLKNTQQKLKSAEAGRDSLINQSERLSEREIEAERVIDAARNNPATTDSINKLLDR